MIWCLHGFLGRGADWNRLRTAWPSDLPALQTPDLFAGPPLAATLEAFGARLAADVAAADPAPLLLGYSLGGRLALHALLARPALWRGAVIVSAHLGLESDADRAARCAEDAAWAGRFRTDGWARLLAHWNAREVFGGRTVELERPESAYDREALATALTTWSLGTQAPLAPRLGELKAPVLWVAGADDARYVAQGRMAERSGSTIRLALAPHTGHRVPWEAEAWFRDTVVEFVRGAL